MSKYLITVMAVLIILITACNLTDKNVNELKKYKVKQTTDEVTQDDFVFRLVSEKPEYETGEVVRLYGEIEYIGDQVEISIFHSSSAIIFSMQEEMRGYEIGFGVNDIGITTKLKKGEPYREEYTKSIGYSEDDEKHYVKFMKAFIKDDNFPSGYYLVEGSTDFVIDTDSKERVEMNAKVDFKVVD